ncbi:hypothetical protein GRF29_164g1204069 [Pseudopithomyces chartarum]|uniref:Uncharacterized protein n=1 Tax=Pseudopithomyces chartarum TaxID=1892770 RepID=A0AAN6RCX4_9PLEO|nr:hypothetical protein GRF29_164g1204069 [Pseudopithomyces chartarum]
MSSWFQRTRRERQESDENHGDRPSQAERDKAKPRQPPVDVMPQDPNAPLNRLQLHQICLYERNMPGDAFVSAHVNRLQRGYYETSALHEGPLEDVYFVSVHFVFHPRDHHCSRFRGATIKVSVQGDFNNCTDFEIKKGWYKPQSHPRILRHAPELMYGAISPEDLQWNFNLSSSLGVTQAPLNASLNPSGGIVKTYKVYDMMSIQGSLRVLKSPLGPEFDVDDAMAVWTLEENLTQRSGLPREFDFVMLVHKPDDVKKVYMSVDLDAAISSWHGVYPEWYTNMPKFLPNVDFNLDMDTPIGQKFLPEKPGRGFNFADLPHSLDKYVNMPGTMYPTADTKQDEPTKTGDQHWRRFRDYQPMRPRSGYQPRLPNIGYQPGLPNGSYHPRLPNGSYQPGLPNGNYQPGLPNNNYQPSLPNTTYQPSLPNPGYRVSAAAAVATHSTPTTHSHSLAAASISLTPTASPAPLSPEKQIATWGQPTAFVPSPVSPPPHFILPESLNLKVTLEHNAASARSPSAYRYSGSTLDQMDSERKREVRRRRSREELKEYGVKQALHVLARDLLEEEKGVGRGRGEKAWEGNGMVDGKVGGTVVR